MNEKKYFKLFACCIPVKGARRSLLCDTQRSSYQLIPNALYEILTRHLGQPLDEIKKLYANDPAVDEYFEFLLAREWGFLCADPTRFPAIDLEWEQPECINNAIIDAGPGSQAHFRKIFAQLDELGCKTLQLRFYQSTTWQQLDAILEEARYLRLRAVELLLRHQASIADEEVLRRLCEKHSRVTSIFFHSAPEERAYQLKGLNVGVVLKNQTVSSADHCGFIDPAYFTINLSTFLESQQHNTCLNRKISVDIDGNIKNCPAMPTNYGNIADTSLHSALLKNGFTDLWTINKDQIEVCKDCEFRHICTDCRAFIERPDDLYSKPSRCAYDPYKAEWNTPAPVMAAITPSAPDIAELAG